MNKKQIILLGCSGHALVVSDCIPESHKIVGYLAPEVAKPDFLQVPYLGSENTIDLLALSLENAFFPAIGNNKIRKKVLIRLQELKLETLILKHSSAVISPSSVIGGATLIAPGCIINAKVNIGRGVIVNSGAIIEHECTSGEFVHIAPGSTLAGDVHIGEGSFIGAGAVVREGIKIGKNCIVGAGSVVLTDIPDNELWVGVPAKRKKHL